MRRLRIEGTEVCLHEPDGAGDWPLLVWLEDALSPWRGGDGFPGELAVGAGCAVARVDYAPDALGTFPQPLSRAYRCLLHLQAEHEGGPPVAVGGDGFGAGLAAATSILARRYGDPPVAARLLLAPLLDARLASPSWRRFGRAEDVDRIEAALAAYAPGLDRTDPLLSPLLDTDLEGLPPTVIVTAWEDPMRDDGERYAERLRAAGAAVLGHRYPGLGHAEAVGGGATVAGATVVRGLASATRLALSRPTQWHEPSSSRRADVRPPG